MWNCLALQNVWTKHTKFNYMVYNCQFYHYFWPNETGSWSPCMRPRSDPPNFSPIEGGEKQTNNID